MEKHCAWLFGYLKHHGPTTVSTVQEAGKKDGYTRRDLKIEKKELGVKTWHKPNSEEWYCYLPADENKLPL